MSQIVSTTTGLYPLPDWAKDDLPEEKGRQKDDLIGGTESEQLASIYEDVRTDLIERQQTAGLDRIVEGQGRWDDMLAHPLAVSESVETRGIVRYYDNNNFYREPVVTESLAATGDVGAELESAREYADDSLQAVLPGPYSLADLATDEHYGDSAEFLDAIAEFLTAETAQFPDVETLLLLEPSLVENTPEDSQHASEAIDTVASAIDAEVVVYPYWGALEERTYAHLLDADIDAVGFDLVTDHDANAYNAGEYGTTDDVALGIVDGQTTLVESPDELRERIDWFDERTHGTFDRVYALPNTGLFYLPVNRFEEKLDVLGALTTEVTA